MNSLFEEIDYVHTPLGGLSLRRRRDLSLDVEIYEIKLDDQFLMSSLFTASEVALACLGLAELAGDRLDVVVGGLGLGYTARAVLKHAQVQTVVVVEALEAVIDWHVERLLPLGNELTTDPRCHFVRGDFFALARSTSPGFDPDRPGHRFDAVLVDIDHSPKNCLSDSHRTFYIPRGLHEVAAHIRPGGVFALWSNDPPDEGFATDLRTVFENVQAHVVTFPNPHQNKAATNTIYIGRTKQDVRCP